jgi:putative membrane protein
MKNAVIAGVVAFAISVVPSFGDSTSRTKPTPDQQFVSKAADANMAEIELGRLAETRSANEQVRAFARRMVDDHQRALDRLKPIARREKVELLSSINPKDQALKSRLEKLSSPAFDKAYMTAMVQDHQQDVAKEYAATTLPTLEEHLKVAEQTDKAVHAE